MNSGLATPRNAVMHEDNYRLTGAGEKMPVLIMRAALRGCESIRGLSFPKSALYLLIRLDLDFAGTHADVSWRYN